MLKAIDRSQKNGSLLSKKLNQIRTIDKVRVIQRLGHLPNEIMSKVDEAIKISLGLITV